MSVTFYNKYNQKLKEIDALEGRCEENTLSRDIIIYADVRCGEFDITFEVLDNRINKWFPYQFDDGLKIVEYKRRLSPGKYRILLPTTKNEDKIAINFKGIKNTENIDADFYIIPNFNQY
jgi:hypothetical protein